jgi:hypothetical protein
LTRTTARLESPRIAYRPKLDLGFATRSQRQDGSFLRVEFKLITKPLEEGHTCKRFDSSNLPRFSVCSPFPFQSASPFGCRDKLQRLPLACPFSKLSRKIWGRRHTKTSLTSGEDRQGMIDIVDLILPRKVFEGQTRRPVLDFTTVQSEVST